MFKAVVQLLGELIKLCSIPFVQTQYPNPHLTMWYLIGNKQYDPKT